MANNNFNMCIPFECNNEHHIDFFPENKLDKVFSIL